MVVFTPSVIPVGQTCPVTAAALPPYSAAMYPVTPITAVPCPQKIPPPSMIPGSTIITAPPPAPTLSTSPTVQFASNSNTPVNITPTIVPCNGIPSSTIVTYNPSFQHPVATYNNRNCSTPPVSCTQTVASKHCINNNQVITSYVPIPSHTYTTATMVHCGQRFLRCDPSICPLNTAIIPTTTTICPIPTTNHTFVATVPSWKQSYGMEQVWQCEFKTLFSQYLPHSWFLLPVSQKPLGVWNTNVDSAKVRFCCEDCGHGWTSMKGRVAFWFILNPASGEGLVCLKLYGQQCDRCKTGNYEPAMWYPEEVIKVLVNIYNRVGQAYYGFQQAPYHRTRRPGKPRTPHNSELCQACKDGVCSERR